MQKENIVSNNDFLFINENDNYQHILFYLDLTSYNFEINLLTNGEIHIGFVTRFVHLSNYSKVNDDVHAVMIKSDIFKCNDILNCFVDTLNKTIEFYKNGKKLNIQKPEKFFDFIPVFAIVSLSSQQQVKINFNQTLEKGLVKQYDAFQSTNLHNWKKDNKFEKWNCQTNVQILKLYQTKLPSFFTNDKQKKYNKAMMQLQEIINNTSANLENDINYFLKPVIVSNNKTSYCQFLQAAIENCGSNINENQISCFAYCLAFINKFLREHKSNTTYIVHSMLLYYFDTLNLNLVNDTLPIRNLCIFLAQNDFFIFKNICCKHVSNQSISFLRSVLTRSVDHWSKLFALIALKKIIPYSEYFLKRDKIVDEFIDFWKNEKNLDEMVRHQLFLCAHIFYEFYDFYHPMRIRLLTLEQTYERFSQETDYLQMNPNDKNEYVKLFPYNNLLVRNDENGLQTIRSNFSINPGIYYFEVTILTNGPMRIGLASKQMDIRHALGDNKLSFGIDGFNCCLIIDNNQYSFKTICPRWKPEDVVGVYFDSFKHLINFTINNKIIEFDTNPFANNFDFNCPYYVAASLGIFQQCIFNFKNISIPSEILNDSNILGNITKIHNSAVFLSSNASIRDMALKDSSDNNNNNNNSFKFKYCAKHTENNCRECKRNEISNKTRIEWVQNNIMKEETMAQSFSIWTNVTKNINLAYYKLLNGRYKKDITITLTACEEWIDSLELIIDDLIDASKVEIFMQKIGKIKNQLNSDVEQQEMMQNLNKNKVVEKEINESKKTEKSGENTSLATSTPMILVPLAKFGEFIKLEKNNFQQWLSNLKIILCAENVINAIEKPLDELDPSNLIAKGRILLSVSAEFQAFISYEKIAYNMINALQEKCESNDLATDILN